MKNSRGVGRTVALCTGVGLSGLLRALTGRRLVRFTTTVLNALPPSIAAAHPIGPPVVRR